MWANKCPAIVNERRVIGPGAGALSRPATHGTVGSGSIKLQTQRLLENSRVNHFGFKEVDFMIDHKYFAPKKNLHRNLGAKIAKL